MRCEIEAGELQRLFERGVASPTLERFELMCLTTLNLQMPLIFAEPALPRRSSPRFVCYRVLNRVFVRNRCLLGARICILVRAVGDR